MPDFKETDLYLPVKNLFEDMGFTVRAEVKDCDLFAVMDDKTVVAELKKSFNITLVYQLLNRQTFCKNVYAVIPRPKKGAKDNNFKSMVKLCRKLDFGLITVALDSPVKFAEVIISPNEISNITNYKKKTSAKKEAVSRSGDYNIGGSTGKKIITAYREKSIELLCLISVFGPVSGASLREMGYEKGVYSILYKNYYKWFEKTRKGIYGISESGKKAVDDEKYKSIVEYYMSKFNNQKTKEP